MTLCIFVASITLTLNSGIAIAGHCRQITPWRRGKGWLWLRPHRAYRAYPVQERVANSAAFGCVAVRTVPCRCLTKVIFSISVAGLEMSSSKFLSFHSMSELVQQEYKRLTGQDSSTLEGPLSEDALANLKLYKYSSVDKSFTSRYILKHYVR